MRPDAVPIIDGDPAGDGYLVALEELLVKPRCAVRYGSGAAVECPVAWIVEQPLTAPGVVLAELLPDTSHRTVRGLQQRLAAQKEGLRVCRAAQWAIQDLTFNRGARLITGVYGLQL